jgi:hypothetical protein
VAVAAAGSVLAVGASNGVKGQLFNPDGSKNGSTFDISTDTGDLRPRVTVDDGGDFTVLCMDENAGDVVAKKFDSSGTEIGGEITLSTSAPTTGRPADIDAGGGRVMATWTRFSDEALVARVIDGNHTAEGSDPFVLENSFNTTAARVNLNASGEGAISYADNDNGPFFYQRVSASGAGSTTGGAISIGTAVNDLSAVEVFDDDSLAVTFENSNGVALSEFDSSDTETRSTTDLGPNSSSQTVFGRDDNGNFIVSFSDSSTGNVSIQAFGSLNDPPEVTTSSGAVDFVEDGGAITVDSGLTVSEPDDDSLTGASVSIQGGVFDSGDEVLSVTDDFGITSTYDGGSGVLTLSGTASAADYQSVLRTLQYQNNSQTPDTATRTLSITATDDQDETSTAATRDVTVEDTPADVDVTASTLHGDYWWSATYYVDEHVVYRIEEEGDPKDGRLLECREST